MHIPQRGPKNKGNKNWALNLATAWK